MAARKLCADLGLADALLLALILVWGVNYTIIKVSLAQLSPLAFNAARFLLATFTILGLMRATGKPMALPPKERKQAALLGILANTVYQLFFIEGLARTSVSHAALIQASMPAQVALLSHLTRKERLTPKAWAGIALTMVGLGLLLSWRTHQEAGAPSLLGDGLMFAASFSWACYTLLAQPLLARMPASSVTAVGFLAGTPLLVLVAAPQILRHRWWELSLAAWGGVFFSGVLAIGLGYFVWNFALRQLGTTRTAIYSNLTPVVAALLAWVTLRERWHLGQLVGAALALAGVSWTRLAQKAGRESWQTKVVHPRRGNPPLGSAQAGRFSGGKRPGLFSSRPFRRLYASGKAHPCGNPKRRSYKL
jgi:drug/metabolite transporter (DMT)-like permease